MKPSNKTQAIGAGRAGETASRVSGDIGRNQVKTGCLLDPISSLQTLQPLEKAQNGNGHHLQKVGMELASAPRPLGVGVQSAGMRTAVARASARRGNPTDRRRPKLLSIVPLSPHDPLGAARK
jgi:hypothetical protein